MQAITIGLDIAKSVFQVHAEDAAGKIVAQKQNTQAGAHRVHCTDRQLLVQANSDYLKSLERRKRGSRPSPGGRLHGDFFTRSQAGIHVSHRHWPAPVWVSFVGIARLACGQRLDCGNSNTVPPIFPLTPP
jgi:hypothetical protein